MSEEKKVKKFKYIWNPKGKKVKVPVKEEVITEISRSTLTGYIEKANRDSTFNSGVASIAAVDAKSASAAGNDVLKKHADDIHNKASAKAQKRSDGVSMALNKKYHLSGAKVHAKEEVEHIDEASDQAKANKTRKNLLDTVRGSKYKMSNAVLPDREAGHKNERDYNKALGRGLRAESVWIDEMVDELNEDVELLEYEIGQAEDGHYYDDEGNRVNRINRHNARHVMGGLSSWKKSSKPNPTAEREKFERMQKKHDMKESVSKKVPKEHNGYSLDLKKHDLLRHGVKVADALPLTMFGHNYEFKFSNKKAEAEWHDFCGSLSQSEVAEILAGNKTNEEFEEITMVSEAIAYAMSSANSNAEFKRNQPKVPAGYKGVHTEPLDDYDAFKKKSTDNFEKAKKAGHDYRSEHHPQTKVMVHLSKTMDSSALKKFVSEEVEQIDEISKKLAGNYYNGVVGQHVKKVGGVKPDMLNRVEKDLGKNRKVGLDRAFDRVFGSRKVNEEVEFDAELMVENEVSFSKIKGEVTATKGDHSWVRHKNEKGKTVHTLVHNSKLKPVKTYNHETKSVEDKPSKPYDSKDYPKVGGASHKGIPMHHLKQARDEANKAGPGKYRAIFRGPRGQRGAFGGTATATRKGDAHSFDLYRTEEAGQINEATFAVKHDGVAHDHEDAHLVKLFHGKKNVINHLTKYEDSAIKTKKLLSDKGFQNVRIEKNGKLHEEVELDEAVDKSHPIYKEYQDLKKHDIKQLRSMIGRTTKVVNLSGFETKDHAISTILREKHGHKRVADVFGLNEEVELDEADLRSKVVSWLVQPASKKSFNKPFKLEQEEEARSHAKATGGKLIGVDSNGHAIRYNRHDKSLSESVADKDYYKSAGFTEITKHKDHYIISHNGNMGNTEERSVKPNVDRLLGKGAFDYLKKHGKAEGSPDYSYSLTVHKSHFENIPK